MADQDMNRRLPKFWREDRHLSFFLVFLLIIIIFVPMVGASRLERIAIDLVFALMLVFGAVATLRNRMLIFLITALTVVELASDLLVEFYPWFSAQGWGTSLKLFSMAILVIMTLRMTFLPGPVNVHRVLGGVAAYLLIGVTWTFAYRLVMESIPDAIHFPSTFPRGSGGQPSGLLYFSFETLTTVSYGDVYPVDRVARSLAIAEALIGQLYPSILIATLVGMALQSRFSAAPKEDVSKRPT